MHDFQSLIAEFGGPKSLVDALAEIGVSVDRAQVQQWKLRNSIPAGEWWAVLKAAALKSIVDDQGATLTSDLFARWASKHPVAAE